MDSDGNSTLKSETLLPHPSSFPPYSHSAQTCNTVRRSSPPLLFPLLFILHRHHPHYSPRLILSWRLLLGGPKWMELLIALSMKPHKDPYNLPSAPRSTLSPSTHLCATLQVILQQPLWPSGSPPHIRARIPPWGLCICSSFFDTSLFPRIIQNSSQNATSSKRPSPTTSPSPFSSAHPVFERVVCLFIYLERA